MAGSLNHIIDKRGSFTMNYIENLGDAHEALEECFLIIYQLTNGDKKTINRICEKLNFPQIKTNMNNQKSLE